MALTPIALIPQVVLGGLMVPMTTNPNLKPLMYMHAGALGLRGRHRAASGMAIADRRAWNIDLAQAGPHERAGLHRRTGKFQCAIAQVASDTLTGAWGFTEWDHSGFPRPCSA